MNNYPLSVNLWFVNRWTYGSFNPAKTVNSNQEKTPYRTAAESFSRVTRVVSSDHPSEPSQSLG